MNTLTTVRTNGIAPVPVLAFTLATLITPLASASEHAHNVTLYSQLTPADLGADFAEDCWGYVSPSGREYTIIGISAGTALVEITDPFHPVILGIVPTANKGRDMKVYQHYVYSISESGPLNVIDLAGIDNQDITLTSVLRQHGAHNLAVDEQSGYLYLALGGPMVVLDLKNPIVPVVVGFWDGETHDAQVVTYTEGPYAGRQIAFLLTGRTGTLDILDVTDKSNIVLLGRTTWPGAAYAHQGWLSEDRRYFYVGDELDEISGWPTTRTLIVDVSNLAHPTLVGDFTNGLRSTDHNLYVHRGYIFEANYTTGLRIFDACDPLHPVEVGYYDTFPANDDLGFQGAWTAYPFFPSGTVTVCDRSGGLFVLDVRAATASPNRCEAAP